MKFFMMTNSDVLMPNSDVFLNFGSTIFNLIAKLNCHIYSNQT